MNKKRKLIQNFELKMEASLASNDLVTSWRRGDKRDKNTKALLQWKRLTNTGNPRKTRDGGTVVTIATRFQHGILNNKNSIITNASLSRLKQGSRIRNLSSWRERMREYVRNSAAKSNKTKIKTKIKINNYLYRGEMEIRARQLNPKGWKNKQK